MGAKGHGTAPPSPGRVELLGDSHVTGDGGVPGHGLGREVVVAVGAVEEGLSPLAVHKVGLEDEAGARAGHGVQGAAARRGAIVHVETVGGKKHRNTTLVNALYASKDQGGPNCFRSIIKKNNQDQPQPTH